MLGVEKIGELYNTAVNDGTDTGYTEFIEKLRGLDEEKNSWYVNYYFGLAYYSLSCENEDFNQIYLPLSLKHFGRAYKLNPDNVFVQLYFGYANYDVGHFKISNDIFSHLLKHSDTFYELGIEWRVVDCLELLAVGNLNLGFVNKFLHWEPTWEKFFSHYLGTIDEMTPKEMILAVSNYLSKHGGELEDDRYLQFKKICLMLIVIIERKDHLVKLYKNELNQLKNWSSMDQELPLFKQRV